MGKDKWLQDYYFETNLLGADLYSALPILQKDSFLVQPSGAHYLQLSTPHAALSYDSLLQFFFY